MAIKEFFPGTENYKKLIWTNRYFDRIMKLHDINHKSFMKESKNWGSPKHLKTQKLQNRINRRIAILSKYSNLLTKKALS